MVDVLFNCLMRSKEFVEEIASSAPVDEVDVLDMSDGDENWRAIYDHPLTAATSAMLNIAGTSSEERPAEAPAVLPEYYKEPEEKSPDKCEPDPDFWTTMTNGETSAPTEETDAAESPTDTLPLALIPQTAKLLKNKREPEPRIIVSPHVEVYLNNGIVKIENNEGEEGAKPNDTNDSPKSTELVQPSTSQAMNTDVLSDPPLSPIPNCVQVKQEPSSGLSSTPSPPIINVRELASASTVIAQAYPSNVISQGYDSLAAQYSPTTPIPYQGPNIANMYMLGTPPEYRSLPEYYNEHIRQNLVSVANSMSVYGDTSDAASIVDRYIKQSVDFKNGIHGLAMDLPSPDSGIGDTTIMPKENSSLSQVEIFNYSDLSPSLLQEDITPNRPTNGHSSSARRQDYSRSVQIDKLQIPKIHSDVGFQYLLESPISTSQRREDDRITYINKGQFYGITLEFVPDPLRHLKSSTVKSVVMLMFREEKSPEDELKAWQFWHNRQHTMKQRILDADTKNSSGIIGQIDETSHNAIAFYWNPLESPAKVNVAVQCLSTDFSNQKGVKGLPLHLQIDTYDEFRESATPYHRGYCQIKVFCDKGAERKTRDEERRAAKRKLNSGNGAENAVPFPGRKKLEEMFHLPCDRSAFYSMSDILKPPVLFHPSEEVEKAQYESQVASVEMSFYASPTHTSDDLNGSGNDRPESDSRSSHSLTPPPKRAKCYPGDRVLLFARQDTEDAFQPLHIHPPTLLGLIRSIENKYSINSCNVRNIYKQCKKGILVQVDDEIVTHYCNEDVCIIEVTRVTDELCDITLVEV